MTITEASKRTGISIPTLYRQIQSKKGLGRFFYRNNRDKLCIDEKYVLDDTMGKSEA